MWEKEVDTTRHQFEQSDSKEKARRIRQVVEGCRRRREAGEPLPNDSLIEARPDLMPELAAELRTLTWSKADRERAERDEAEGQETIKEGGPGGSSRELHIRCPHCHNPVEIGVDAPLPDIICSSCGSHFSLIDDRRVDDPEVVDGTRKRAIRDRHLPSGLITDGEKDTGTGEVTTFSQTVDKQ